jgi:hypothetical protein
MPGNDFSRFDGCAALDFMRTLGVRVALQQGAVQFESPVFRSAFKGRVTPPEIPRTGFGGSGSASYRP